MEWMVKGKVNYLSDANFLLIKFIFKVVQIRS